MEANGSRPKFPNLEELRRAAESDHPDWAWLKVATSWRIVAAESIEEAIELRYLLALALYNLGDDKRLAIEMFESVLRRARLNELWEIANNAGLQLVLEYNMTGNMPDRDRILGDLLVVARCAGSSRITNFYSAIHGRIAAHPNGSSPN